MRSSVKAALAAMIVVTACEQPDRSGSGFVFEEEASPLPVTVLRSDTSRTPRGFRVAELDVLLPMGISDATARASIQKVIDSVAAADTLAAAVQVVGYVIGEIHPERGQADVVPGMMATWAPVDSVGITGAQRRSRFRTEFRVLRPFGTDSGSVIR